MKAAINFPSILLLSLFVADYSSGGVVVFSTDFESGVPSEFSGITNIEPVQGYNGYGTGANVFAGSFLRNASTGNSAHPENPGTPTTLTLTGLPAHSSVDINFLLAIIDSWDGEPHNNVATPDYFSVTVDGIEYFEESFENSNEVGFVQGYSPPAGVELVRKVQLGFTPDDVSHRDSAYDLGLDPALDGIAHTGSTLTIHWQAFGTGWQGGIDESFAIDNVEVILNGVVPEPSSLCLFILGAGAILLFRRSLRP